MHLLTDCIHNLSVVLFTEPNVYSVFAHLFYIKVVYYHFMQNYVIGRLKCSLLL